MTIPVKSISCTAVLALCFDSRQSWILDTLVTAWSQFTVSYVCHPLGPWCKTEK